MKHERNRVQGRLYGLGLLSVLCAVACGGPSGPSDSGGGGASSTPGPTPTPTSTSAPSPPENAVAGTITLPAGVTGRCIMIAVDTDTTGSNGVARRADGSEVLSYQLVTGATATFSLDRVPAGTYFLWGYVDVDRSVSNPPASCELVGGPNRGDHLGYFATGLIPPSTPNLTVPHAATARFDFQLGVFP